MSGDEPLALILFGLFAAVSAGARTWRMFSLTSLARAARARTLLIIAGVACAVALWAALRFFAAREVRETIGYQLLFLAAGIIALEMSTHAFAALGLDAHGDALERNNPAALPAVIGLWIAVTNCAIGANLGEGDDIFTTLVPLALAALILIGFGLGWSAGTRGFAGVVVERDRAAGLRCGGALIAASLPLAKAASGDWVSLSATLRDFAAALPFEALLLAVTLAVESAGQRARRAGRAWASRPGGCVLPALAYLGLGSAGIFLGP